MRQYQVELVSRIQTNIRNPNLKPRSNPDFNSPPIYLSIISFCLSIYLQSMFSPIYTYLSIANLTKLSFLPHFYLSALLCVLPGVGWSTGGYGFSFIEWSENKNLDSRQHEIIATVLHYIEKYVLDNMSMKYEKSHKTDAPQHGISFPFLLDIFTKSLTLYHNSCIILMSCYFLSISLLSWCTFLKMTLIECQSPLKARDWGHALPFKKPRNA